MTDGRKDGRNDEIYVPPLFSEKAGNKKFTQSNCSKVCFIYGLCSYQRFKYLLCQELTCLARFIDLFVRLYVNGNAFLFVGKSRGLVKPSPASSTLD